MFQKKTLAALLIAVSPVAAFAANTIYFEGEVRANTCNVTVNSSATPTVLLPTVSTTDLAAVGAIAGVTNFRVDVSGCTAPLNNTELKTVFTGNNVTTAGSLGNTGGTATNVALRIFTDAAGAEPINLSSSWTSPTGKGIDLPASQTSAFRDYYVGYIAEGGAAGVGTVRGSMQYAVIYN